MRKKVIPILCYADDDKLVAACKDDLLSMLYHCHVTSREFKMINQRLKQKNILNDH